MEDPRIRKSKSSTMRIELIPEIQDSSIGNRPRQTVATTTRPGVAPLVRPGVTGGVRSPGQQSYQELFQSVYDAGIITDLRGRIRDVNRRAVDFFGYPPEIFRQHTIPDVICGMKEDILQVLSQNLMDSRFTLMEAYCIRASGEQFVAEIAVSQMHLTTPHLCFFVRDITSRRQIDEMLRTEHAAIQNAPGAIVVVDSEGRLEYANPATLRLWRFPKTFAARDINETPLADFFTDPGAVAAVLASLGGETAEWKGTLEARRSDGSTFFVEANATLTRNTEGDIAGTVISFDDLSSQKDATRLRETLAGAAEKTAALADWFNDFSAALPADARAALLPKLQAGVDAIEGLAASLSDIP